MDCGGGGGAGGGGRVVSPSEGNSGWKGGKNSTEALLRSLISFPSYQGLRTSRQ